jgi:hypothetical protein
MNEAVPKLVSLNEIARIEQVNYKTMRRRCTKAGLTPDALLCGGTIRNPVPLFFEERIPQIKEIIKTPLKHENL